MALTDKELRSLKDPGKYFDGGGMFMLVHPDGGKYWRLKYRFAGKEKLLSFGVYPDVSLKAAREKRDDARQKLAKGVDPSEQRKEDRRQSLLRAENTFATVAREWWEIQKEQWSPAHRAAVLRRMEGGLFPKLGARPIAEIEPPEVLDAIRTIESRGALEVASKSLIVAGQVFRFAVATGRAKSDPTRDLRGALKPREVNHYPSLEEGELPEFLGRLDRYVEDGGKKLTQLALNLLLLTWSRPGEVRFAMRAEFNLEKAEWRIPDDRMKGRIERIVPLPTQALAVVREILELPGGREHLFPNEHKPQKHMSENTLGSAINRMGYKGKLVAHGIRHTASTIMNGQHEIEKGGAIRRLWHPDWIEEQLAHKVGGVRHIYNGATYLPERAHMMQSWADYLDGLRAGDAKVNYLKKAA